MTTSPDEIVRPTKQRLASEYKDVARAPLNKEAYPCTSSITDLPTHDLAYCQSILNNANNFAEETTCDVFEVDGDGRSYSTPNLRDEQLRLYMDVRAVVIFLLEKS